MMGSLLFLFLLVFLFVTTVEVGSFISLLRSQLAGRIGNSRGSSLSLTTLKDLLANSEVKETPVAHEIPRELHNSYLGLRHGQSMANIAGIISSDPDVGCKIHGLSALGKAQARGALTSLFEKLGGRDFDLSKVVFMSSNFTRARETAEECIKAMQLSLAMKHHYDTDPTKASYEKDNDGMFKEIDLFILKLVMEDMDKPGVLQEPDSKTLSDLLMKFKDQIGKAFFYRMYHFAEKNKEDKEKERYLSLLESVMSYVYVNEDEDIMARIDEELPELSSIISSKYSIPLQIDNRLRERYFGKLDASLLITYNYVWPIDKIDADNKRYNVESVNEVVSRVLGLIHDLEKRYTDKTIVFVSHADTLQITQAFMARIDARTFSQIRFKNGEVRYMEEKGLPVPSPLEYVDPFESVGDKFEPVPIR